MFEDVYISKTNTPIAVYNKKNEYGPAEAYFKNINTKKKLHVQNGSKLNINGKYLPATEFDYEKL